MRALLAACVVVILMAAPLLPSAAASSQADASARATAAHINAYRAEFELPAMELEPRLNRAAARKAQHMQKKQYWAHYSPDGDSPWQFIEDSGYDYRRAGENLAIGFSDDRDVVDGWIDSATHEAALRGDYSHVGIDVRRVEIGQREGVLVVAMFAEPAGAISRTASLIEETALNVLTRIVSPPVWVAWINVSN